MKKLGISIKINIILIVAILLAGIILLRTNIKTNVNTETIKFQSYKQSESVNLENFQSSVPSHSGEYFSVDGDKNGSGGYGDTPTADNMHIYSTSNGTTTSTTSGITAEEIYNYQQSNKKVTVSHGGYNAVHVGDSLLNVKPYGPSMAYYRCQSKHSIMGGGLAYMINQDEDGWSGVFQEAVWNEKISGVNVDNKEPPKTAEQYEAAGEYEKAENVRLMEEWTGNAGGYGGFWNQIDKYEDGNTNAKLEIGYGGGTMVDQESQSYVVGPFDLDYIVSKFGSISSITLTIEGKNIPYTYYVGGKKYDSGIGESQSYPESGSDFYIVYKNEDLKKVGIESHTELTLTATYTWTEYYIEICEMEGIAFSVEWAESGCSHGTCRHLTCDEPTGRYLCGKGADCEERKEDGKDADGNTIYKCGGHKYDHQHSSSCYDDGCCVSCSAESTIVETRQSPIIEISPFSVTKSRTEHITITKEDGFDPSLKIGGNVWEDIREENTNNKEGNVDGKQAEGELSISSIPVSLYEVDYETKNVVKVHESKTDKNGNYSFVNLDPMHKYYVEFKYNGQRYENTIYQAVTENGINPLSGGYSNAAETKDDRDKFNQSFEEVNGDEGYTLKQNEDSFEEYDTYLPENENFADTKEAIFKISAYTQNYPKTDWITIVRPGELTTTETDENGNITHKYANLNIGGDNYEDIYQEGTSEKKNSILEIDFGITKRIQFDMAIKKDLYMATVKINGKTLVYGYDKKNIGNDVWEVKDGEQETYQRVIENADYGFEGQNGNGTEKLEVYATYKIAIRNQSETMLGQVTKLIDHYDETYEYQTNLSWISADNYERNAETLEKLQNQLSPSSTNVENFKITGVSENDYKNEEGNIVRLNPVIDEENNTLTIDVGKKQAAGETVYLYLTFKVKNDGENGIDGKIQLGEKKNDVEIGAFKTYYAQGTVLPHYNGGKYTVTDADVANNMIAGRIDKDSIPNNYNGNEPKEDDENKSPGLDVRTAKEPGDPNYKGRVISGTVWEDERTMEVNDAIIGNGIKDVEERKVSGVKVQLIELVPTGKTCRWAEVATDENGVYEFANIVPGDYVVRFVYGEDGSKYNGQDYKTTLYQIEVDQYNEDGEQYATDADKKYYTYTDTENQNKSNVTAVNKYEVTEENKEYKYGYDIAKSEDKNVSDAKDLWNGTDKDVDIVVTNTEEIPELEVRTYKGREEVNNYSKEGVTNHKAEVLASLYETPTYKKDSGSIITTDVDKLQEELSNETKMTAETGVIVMEVEKNTQTVTENDSPAYTIGSVDLGLVERPKAQLEIDKSIMKLRLVLANGSVLFDVDKGAKVDDFIWKNHAEYSLENYKKDLEGNVLEDNKDSLGKYEEYYEEGTDRYKFRETANDIASSNDNGLIQITMDEEVMHGAAIQITYNVKVTNVGEIDYVGKEYYYLGTNPGDIVTTRADKVVDYVANNLQFYGESVKPENEGWAIVSKEDLMKEPTTEEIINANLVNYNLEDKVNKFNNIIITEELNNDLKPGEEAEKILILSQLITTKDEDNDLTYSNMVEIVKTSNTVGRRMAYSVVGNQDPTALKAAEVDSSLADRVIILPPFGEVHLYYILGAVIALMLIGGITLIIKKVLK